jgi:hypothetical protein
MQSSAAGSGSVGKRAPKSAARFYWIYCRMHFDRAKSILMFNIFLVHEQKSLTCTKPGVWVRKTRGTTPPSISPASRSAKMATVWIDGRGSIGRG